MRESSHRCFGTLTKRSCPSRFLESLTFLVLLIFLVHQLLNNGDADFLSLRPLAAGLMRTSKFRLSVVSSSMNPGMLLPLPSFAEIRLTENIVSLKSVV